MTGGRSRSQLKTIPLGFKARDKHGLPMPASS